MKRTHETFRLCFTSLAAFAGAAVVVAMPPSALGQKIVAPASGAYFGASANPDGKSPVTDSNFDGDLERETQHLETQIGRTLTLHMHYFDFIASDGTATFTSAAFKGDVTAKRTPVISWSCPVDGTSDSGNADIIAGMHDADIDTQAAAIIAFGHPVFIRYEWEMNGNNKTDCSNGTVAENQASFVGAWQYIYNRFQSDGVTNVTWLWCPKGTDNALGFYPGSDYVDWIGDDEYVDGNTNPMNDFSTVFSDFASSYSSMGKPLMVAETGGCPAKAGNYVASANTELQTSAFADFRAFMYWDSPSQEMNPYHGCSHAYVPWALNSDPSGNGYAEFSVMGSNAYFATRSVVTQ